VVKLGINSLADYSCSHSSSVLSWLVLTLDVDEMALNGTSASERNIRRSSLRALRREPKPSSKEPAEVASSRRQSNSRQRRCSGGGNKGAGARRGSLPSGAGADDPDTAEAGRLDPLRSGGRKAPRSSGNVVPFARAAWNVTLVDRQAWSDPSDRATAGR
jgi:hypothetical protein